MWNSFPLNGGGRIAGDVEADAVDILTLMLRSPVGQFCGIRLSDTVRGGAFGQSQTKLCFSHEMLDMPIQLNLNLLTMKSWIKRRQSRNCLLGQGKILGVKFDANSVVTNSLSRRDDRSGAQEGVKNSALAKRQEGTNQNPHEMLRL